VWTYPILHRCIVISSHLPNKFNCKYISKEKAKGKGIYFARTDGRKSVYVFTSPTLCGCHKLNSKIELTKAMRSHHIKVIEGFIAGPHSSLALLFRWMNTLKYSHESFFFFCLISIDVSDASARAYTM
jgi:ribosomal protein L24E